MEKEFIPGKKRVKLEEIKSFYRIEEYPELVECIKILIEEDKIKPIKAAKINGKKPALYNEYHVIEKKKNYKEYEEELKFLLCPLLDNSYYRKNLERYERDREKILQFNEYLINHKDCLQYKISLNERSFEIWGREKYLKEEGGRVLLKNLHFDIKDLGVYETIEPFAYYSHHKKISQNIIIIENKDTFYSMRKYMLEGHDEIMGIKVGTLIYGGGKGILKSMKDFDICVEPYICDEKNKILYFGDLDYEGILIYENLYKTLGEKYQMEPFIRAYETMLVKSQKISKLPDTKVGQNRNISTIFLNNFNETISKNIEELLESGKYIPQEILNFLDFR